MNYVYSLFVAQMDAEGREKFLHKLNGTGPMGADGVREMAELEELMLTAGPRTEGPLNMPVAMTLPSHGEVPEVLRDLEAEAMMERINGKGAN